jgi:ribonuclease P protein component
LATDRIDEDERGEGLPRESRLRGRDRIGDLFAEGTGGVSGAVLAKALPNPDGRTRVVAVAGKKMGCAVKRNRMRRRLRAAFRAGKESLPKGHDFALVARRGILEASWRDLLRNVETAMRRAVDGGAAPSGRPRPPRPR